MSGDGQALERLVSLVGGEPPTGRVLAQHTHRDDVEAVLGDTGADPDGVGRLGVHPATFRDYPESPLAPLGITAWFDDDRLLALIVPLPSLPEGWVSALGPPDRRDSSPLGRAMERAGWDDAAVVIHRHRATGEVERLDLLAGASIEWLDDEPPVRRERR